MVVVRPIRTLLVLPVAAAALLAAAQPASAHDLGGRQPTDIRARVAHGPLQWRIPLRVDARAVSVVGEARLIHAGAWWAWFLLSTAIVGVVVVAARRAWRATVIVVLTAMITAGVVHVVAGWASA